MTDLETIKVFQWIQTNIRMHSSNFWQFSNSKKQTALFRLVSHINETHWMSHKRLKIENQHKHDHFGPKIFCEKTKRIEKNWDFKKVEICPIHRCWWRILKTKCVSYNSKLMLLTPLCWWRLWPFWSPTSTFYISVGHRNSVGNIHKSSITLSHQQKTTSSV